MEENAKKKTIHIQPGHLRFHTRGLERKKRPKGLEVLGPSSGDHVCSPFVVYGTFDAGATEADVTVTSESTDQPYDGTPVDPPDGADWAYQFDVPPQDVYDVTDVENTTPPTTYSIVGVYVDC